ncbi:hypothetical protein LSH36_261g01006, partial [Paralvinella palmiformis]
VWFHTSNSDINRHNKSLVLQTVLFLSLALPTAVSVARTTNISGAADPLNFLDVVVNIGDGWNRSVKINNTLDVEETSIYFFHLNAGAMSGCEVNMNIRGSYNADILRTSTSHTGIDTLSRDFIQTVNAGLTIKVTNEYLSNLFSDSGRQTSFTAFDLQTFLSSSNQKIFSVARQTGYTTYGELPFDDVLVDTGGDWTGSRYTITKAGLYFFTLSCGVTATNSIRAQVVSATNGVLAEIWRGSTSNNGEDTLNNVVMADLVEGDYVYINYISGELYSDGDRQTSFAGFQYTPVEGNQHAWSVFRTSSYDVGVDPVDPLPFNGSSVNTDLYSFDDHQVHITQSGLYYVSLNVGVKASSTLEAYISRGTSRTEAQISRSSTVHNGEESMGQGLLLELSAGDVLKIILGSESQLFSDKDKQTIFSGLLLYPYPN